MKKQIINLPGVRRFDSPFSHVVKANDFIFLTSQLSTDLNTGQIIAGDITIQTRQALENIRYLLRGCGADMDDIVKVVVYMRNVNDFQKMNEVYRQFFTRGQEPARVTIQAISPIEGVDIEIEATAIAQN